ncbi:MAG TPA: Tim44-like domain-containing protein [Solirubrobacteraceae bacterium]
MRRALPAALLLVLLSAGPALAAAGGGSSGFGGGGGGGGGGFSGGGGSTSGSGSGGGFAGFLFFVLIVLVVFAIGAIGDYRRRKRRRERVAMVELHSAKAADDDPAFAPAAVRESAARLFREVQAAWTARDETALARYLGPDLLVEWKRRLADFERKGWHNVCELRADPEVEYVGLVNRTADEEDRVVVRITAQMRDYVKDRHGNVIKKSDSASPDTTLEEYWTLAKRDGAWMLFSIEQDDEGSHHLESAIVATPWEDDQRLQDASATELAVADAIPDTQIREVADLDFDGDARVAAMDLSVVDGRFAPGVLEAAARRAVDAWAEAVDGDDAPLEAVASPEAVRALLHPRGDKTRLVVRGPQLQQLRITGVDAATQPATMRVEARVAGRRYIEDRDTLALLSGSKDAATTFTEHWTLALDGTGETPWRIVGT